jgi:isopenicillin N synthase-like dioxygenase
MSCGSIHVVAFALLPPLLSCYVLSFESNESPRYGLVTTMTEGINDDGTAAACPFEIAPLIELTSELWKDSDDAVPSHRRQEIGTKIVSAFQSSGFLLIQSDLMPAALQQQALQDATRWLTTKDSNSPLVTTHPTDPKKYVMLEGKHFLSLNTTTNNNDDTELKSSLPFLTPTLIQYWEACEELKMYVLRAIGVGLGLQNPDDLARWHARSENSAMRLLYYPPVISPTTGNRCKAHSDYGSVTLLSTDGVSGLEIMVHGKWWPVPHIPGTLVVNIGSLLSEWTTRTTANNSVPVVVPPLLATLHRVAGPASENHAIDPAVLAEAMVQGRTSIAFFADPDSDTPLTQEGTTMEDYILWRSGGTKKNADRSGVAFTPTEEEEQHQQRSSANQP